MTDGMVKSLGVGRFLDWRTIEAAGAAGGVLICWDKRSLELLEWEEGQFSISCKFRTVENGAIWVFTGGDFNVILSQGERSRQGRISPAMRRFAQVMDDLELIDPPLQGGSFTWSGGFQNQAWARLDRFENMWLKVEGFKDLLRSWWQGMSVSGRASYKLATKLKVIKQKLKVRNKRLDYWDQVESERADRGGAVKEKEAKDDYAKWEQEVRNGIVDAFQRLLTEDLEWKADIGGLDLNQISQQEADTLELPFTKEEVHSALMDMNRDKAPGPDGFTGAFWQFCWEFVKEEVLEMFKDFHEQKAFLKSLNTTLSSPYPKKEERRSWGFQPIT
ncbi:hypothetical protein AAG906_011465 [Vitis piasezkii]